MLGTHPPNVVPMEAGTTIGEHCTYSSDRQLCVCDGKNASGILGLIGIHRWCMTVRAAGSCASTEAITRVRVKFKSVGP